MKKFIFHLTIVNKMYLKSYCAKVVIILILLVFFTYDMHICSVSFFIDYPSRNMTIARCILYVQYARTIDSQLSILVFIPYM